MTERESCSVFVLGATPSGVATAVRASREGVDVVLASYHPHLGGALPSLGGLDSFFEGSRAPILEELREAIATHYREEFGEDSEAYARSVGRTIPHISSYEPHVAEAAVEAIVDDAEGVDALRGYHLDDVRRDDSEIRSVTLDPVEDGREVVVTADTYVDATYEGDLLAAAGVPYRVGREARTDFDEQHAGKIFTTGGTGGGNVGAGEYSRDAAAGDLNLKVWGEVSKEILSGSTGEGDDAIQAYCFRLCMTDDPENQRPIEKPDDYDRSRYRGIVESPEEALEGEYPLHSRFLKNDPEDLSFPYSGPDMPNGKVGMNAGNLVGGADDYPEADWEQREEILEAHLNHALGLMYFMQNDDEVPEAVQEEAREWGLAADEFVDYDNRPRQVYVREGRRMDGRCVLTENDFRVAPGLDRPPLFEDAIATAGDWYMDSHSCTTERRRGSLGDGKILLTEVTRPTQIPYRALLPEGLDNLLVPGALSATHVAWGAIRLEPTWMHVGEAAGFAAATAVDADAPVGDLDVDRLQRTLVENGVLLTFFNDLDADTDAEWAPAVQYLGTKGFFETFDARPDDPLTRATARRWAAAAADLREGGVAATDRARALAEADADGTGANDADGTGTVSGEAFQTVLAGELDVDADAVAAAVREWAADPSGPLRRGEAAGVVYSLCT